MRFGRWGKTRQGRGFRGRRASFASAARVGTLGFALAASFGAVGCVGVTGAPAGSSGGGTTPSGSSQGSQLSPSSAAVSFGSVNVGSSTSQLVTLTVAGSENVTISSVAVSGAGFTVSGKSNVTLGPNQSMTISVGFSPQAAGNATGQLLVSSNAANSSLQIGLSGDGVATTSSHSVALNWQPSTSPVTGYFVFRGSTAGNLSQLNATAVASTSFTDKTVANGQTYVYAVKSIDSSNVLSAFSNTVTVTIPSQ